MNPEIDKLLSVLDLSEEEQWSFVVNQPLGIISGLMAFDWSCPENRNALLAALAFRLRDEVAGTGHWGTALVRVYEYVNQKKATSWLSVYDWWMSNDANILYKAKPIHFIIAALIAKELEKE